jgi:hypothetical protein
MSGKTVLPLLKGELEGVKEPLFGKGGLKIGLYLAEVAWIKRAENPPFVKGDLGGFPLRQKSAVF